MCNMGGSRRGLGVDWTPTPRNFNFLNLHNKVTNKKTLDHPPLGIHIYTLPPPPLCKHLLDPNMCMNNTNYVQVNFIQLISLSCTSKNIKNP